MTWPDLVDAVCITALILFLYFVFRTTPRN